MDVEMRMSMSRIPTCAAILIAGLSGCASTEPSFAVPIDCQHPMPPAPNAPWASGSARSMPDDCLGRIDDTRLSTP
ncbi:hypothetical protein [Luteimonas sp. FCS-9]|uniref:hypothetical protein n=1 Tax=Luteimonas sp. FCS-9 TaxID=1547516 RepID=UPI00063E8CB1|nr:hypothetical protein [Luteimonas sp. FCS-9]KLI99878.1 hypothetical protein WQ56_10795 [Luteimonas sp. FCS-9]